MQNLTGQTAIVTGASRGLGFAIAERLAKAGATVHLMARSAEAVESAAQRIHTATGAVTKAWAIDISQGESVQKVFDEIIKNAPSVEILVNNAGITRDGLLLRMKESDFDEVVQINLKSVFLCSRAVMKPMLKQKYGRIINLSSIVGLHGQAGQANYAASKAGIIGFTKSYAKEVATRGITCNAIAPGFIETDILAGFSEEQKKAIAESVPLGRIGSIEDVANCVGFLLSERAQYITGQVIQVDGGLTIR